MNLAFFQDTGRDGKVAFRWLSMNLCVCFSPHTGGMGEVFARKVERSSRQDIQNKFELAQGLPASFPDGSSQSIQIEGLQPNKSYEAGRFSCPTGGEFLWQAESLDYFCQSTQEASWEAETSSAKSGPVDLLRLSFQPKAGES